MTLRSSTHPGSVAQWYKLSLKMGKAAVEERCGVFFVVFFFSFLHLIASGI